MDSGSHDQVPFPVPSHTVSSRDYGQVASFLPLPQFPPPKGIKSYSLNRRTRVSSQGSVGVTSSASRNGASPMPVGYAAELCLFCFTPHTRVCRVLLSARLLRVWPQLVAFQNSTKLHQVVMVP